MIVGHIGIAFGARALRHEAPLVWLLAAAILPDIADGVLAVAGVCNSFGTYSHSVPASLTLAVAAGGLALALTRNRAVALAAAAVVLTHLPLDLFTGRKALWPGGPVAGLFLYRFPVWDFLIELPVVTLGWLMLRRSKAAPWQVTGVAALASLLILQATADYTSAHRPLKPPSPCERITAGNA